MKKSLLVLGFMLIFTSASFALDNAEGPGQGKFLVGLSHLGSEVVQNNQNIKGSQLDLELGLTDDLFIYSRYIKLEDNYKKDYSFLLGTSYAILNEKKGGSFFT